MQTEHDHDNCQLLLPLPGMTQPVTITVAGSATVGLADSRYRGWTFAPAADDLVWSEDDLEEAA